METLFLLLTKGIEIRIKIPNKAATSSIHILPMINCGTLGKLHFCALTG